MHVRPHLDYCDFIYHIPEQTRQTSDFVSSHSLNFQMGTLERVQYQAALAVSGAWKGTNRIKIYDELGWESLDERRKSRRLIQFYKIMTSLTPDYLRIPIPPLRGHLFGYHYANVVHNMLCRTDRYQNSFFPNSVSLWNDLGPELRRAESLSVFKKKIVNLYRPAKKSIFNIYNPNIKWIFQLRVGLSPLKCHKKKHNFRDTPNDTCQCGLCAETTGHFLLSCPSYDVYRNDLFQTLNPILMICKT